MSCSCADTLSFCRAFIHAASELEEALLVFDDIWASAASVASCSEAAELLDALIDDIPIIGSCLGVARAELNDRLHVEGFEPTPLADILRSESVAMEVLADPEGP